jgi:hypothetical protein
MRKSLIILSGILVCALNGLGNDSQSNTTTLESQSRPPGRFSAEITLRITEASIVAVIFTGLLDSVGLAVLDSELEIERCFVAKD